MSETYKSNTLTWKNGRELATYGNYSFGYDANGIRVRKANGTNITNYIVDGSTVLRQSWTSGSNSYVADYIYTEAGTPLAFALSTNGGDYVYYFYETNIQGDVIAIYNSSWTKLAAFYYDAWGKFTEGVFNTTGYTSAVRQGSLFRYRGYIYDTETQLYYLQSRYYDPAVGRFINADDISYLGENGDFASLNLFAYCGDNPVIREDSGGNFWLVSVGIGLATQYIGDVIGNLIDGKTGVDVFRPTSSVGEYIAAGVTALIPGTGLGGALVRNIVAEGITVIEDKILGNEVNVVDSMINVGLGTVLDAGFEKVLDKADDFIRSKMPQNYSSYAHTARQSNPNLTREQIYRSMQRSIRFNRVVSKAVTIGFDIVRSTLPY